MAYPDYQGRSGDEPRCASCGMTYSEFNRLGKFGCPDCYEAFKEGNSAAPAPHPRPTASTSARCPIAVPVSSGRRRTSNACASTCRSWSRKNAMKKRRKSAMRSAPSERQLPDGGNGGISHVHDMLQQPLCPWQDGTGNFNDIVIDSRVRLDRNLKKYVFPDKASDTELAAVLEEGKRQIGTLDTLGHGRYTFIGLDELSPLEREMLAVKHFSSASHIEQPKHRGLLLREDGAVSIMINEEDHFCIQTAAPGFDLQRVWDQAAQVDDALESHLDFAFRGRFRLPHGQSVPDRYGPDRRRDHPRPGPDPHEAVQPHRPGHY